MKMKVSILLLLLLTLFGNTHTYAALNEEEHKLQEQCRKQAETFLKLNPLYHPTNYEHHYNSKLDECFIEMRTSKRGKNEDGIAVELEDGLTTELFDLTENKRYGYFVLGERRSIFACYVLDNYCSGILKWEKLAKSYMED